MSHVFLRMYDHVDNAKASQVSNRPGITVYMLGQLALSTCTVKNILWAVACRAEQHVQYA